MDPVTITVLGTFAGTVVTGGTAVLVAGLNGRKEKAVSTEKSAEYALRERLVLRDEQLEVYRSKLESCEAENRRLREGAR